MMHPFIVIAAFVLNLLHYSSQRGRFTASMRCFAIAAVLIDVIGFRYHWWIR